MASKEPEEDGRPSAPFWMTTYGDMVTLLLTFFILMFAMSSINEAKFLKAAQSLGEALGMLEMNVSVIGEASPATGTEGTQDTYMEIVETMEQIAEIFQQGAIEDAATVEVTGPGEVLIRMGDEVLFDPGRAQIKTAAVILLQDIGKSIHGRTETVYIEGHTDNVPISTPEFPTNWELSAARAASVVRYLQLQGIPPDQLAAVGRGEHKPIAENDNPEGRAKNRRVEMYITWSNGPNE